GQGGACAHDRVEGVTGAVGSFEHELGRGQRRERRVDRPVHVVEVEDGVDGYEIHVGVEVRVDGSDVAPVAAVAVGRPGHRVAGEVGDAGISLVDQLRD